MMQITEEGGYAATSTSAPATGGYIGQGSRCKEDEELYAGLCYKTCNLLTQGAYPIRTSSWTCCASHPCSLQNQEGSIGSSLACDGYDVGGGSDPTIGSFTCPHKPFPCGEGEEDVIGVCYTSCS